MANYEFTDNKEKKRYEFHIDGMMPLIDYMKANGAVYLTHTEVPHKLEGQGIGSALVEECLKDIEAQGMKVVPMCPFVAAYIRKNPKWTALVMRG